MAPRQDVPPGHRKPANTAFKQQRLKAWQPVLTPKTVLPSFFILGLVFTPLGALFLYLSNSASELVLDYTQCSREAGKTFGPMSSSQYEVSDSKQFRDIQWKWDESSGTCSMQFTLDKEMGGPVLQYYRLTNFYQNHRSYVSSFDAKQLLGEVVTVEGLKLTCKTIVEDEGKMVYPCGLVANSLFNDTLSGLQNQEGETVYEFSAKGIAWSTDRELYGQSKLAVEQLIPPPNWRRKYPSWTRENLINPKEDERLQVWMRTSGLPNFKKLYGRNSNKLPGGTYVVQVTDGK